VCFTFINALQTAFSGARAQRGRQRRSDEEFGSMNQAPMDAKSATSLENELYGYKLKLKSPVWMWKGC
jgi:hypothetical protein